MPKLSGTGALPVVFDGSSRETFSGECAARAVVELVRDEVHNVVDAKLGHRDRSNCTAYSSLVLDDLRDAQLFGAWADEEEYGKHTLPCLRRQMGWLPAQLTASALRQRVLAGLRSRGWTSERVARRRTLVAYRALAALLGDTEGEWAFGSSPSTLDALLYGHFHAVRHTLPMRWLVQAACQQRSRLGPPSVLAAATKSIAIAERGGVLPVSSPGSVTKSEQGEEGVAGAAAGGSSPKRPSPFHPVGRPYLTEQAGYHVSSAEKEKRL